jgi:hypothetical protein
VRAANLLKTAVYLVTPVLLMMPVSAQNGQADPHSHDQTTTTTTTAPTQSPAVDALNQSLGGVNSSYHGAHQWYKDDQIGLIVVAVVAVLVIGGIAFANRKKKD